jgi:hypothetical protein
MILQRYQLYDLNAVIFFRRTVEPIILYFYTMNQPEILNSVKYTFVALVSLIVFNYNTLLVQAQETGGSYDTIRISSKGNNQKFMVRGTTISEITPGGYSPQVVSKQSSTLGGDLGSNTYTLLTGAGVGEKKDVDFVFPGILTTDNSLLNWHMNFYCEGSVEKERKRIRKDDGTFGMQVFDLKSIYWGRGAMGFILESGDTIGRYRMVFQPEITPELEEILQDIKEEVFLKSDSAFYLTWEYALVGEFRGKESAVLFNSAVQKVYVIEDISLVGELQLVSDPQTKNRKDLQEFKLLAKNISVAGEKDDLLRLAMLGLWMKTLFQ